MSYKLWLKPALMKDVNSYSIGSDELTLRAKRVQLWTQTMEILETNLPFPIFHCYKEQNSTV
jgi:hypothetical protein